MAGRSDDGRCDEGRGERRAGTTGWLEGVMAALAMEIDNAIEDLAKAERTPGDVAAVDRRARAVANLARAARYVEALREPPVPAAPAVKTTTKTRIRWATRTLKTSRRKSRPSFGPNCSPASIIFGEYESARNWSLQVPGRDLRRAIKAAPRLHDHQFPPLVDWRTWVLLGGRGAGKTFAGAYWLSEASRVDGVTLALVGPALHDVREVMVEGPSGLKAVAEDGHRPRWEAGRKRLVWPNGSTAYAFSAEDPDSLRGPQFHHAWADEYCAWRNAETVLANLRFGLRLGEGPRLTITTTPRPTAALRRVMAQPGVATTRGGTQENAMNLSPGFLQDLKAVYGGTRLEAQELEGLIVETDGALFRVEDLKRARGTRPATLDRVVVAVDPPASAHGDACGIVAAGRNGETGYVLADRSMRGLSPNGWARRVAETVQAHGADAVVAEVNQGGEMVRTILAQAGCTVPIRLVHATRAKRVRAEPVAALYEQGRVIHCDDFPALEEELMALGGDAEGSGPSPDRADALVWALTHLLLDGRRAPRLRRL